MADNRFAKHRFQPCFQMHRPFGQPLRPAAEIAHAIDQIGVRLRGLFGDIGKALFGKIAIETPDAVIDLLL